MHAWWLRQSYAGKVFCAICDANKSKQHLILQSEKLKEYGIQTTCSLCCLTNFSGDPVTKRQFWDPCHLTAIKEQWFKPHQIAELSNTNLSLCHCHSQTHTPPLGVAQPLSKHPTNWMKCTACGPWKAVMVLCHLCQRKSSGSRHRLWLKPTQYLQ